MFGVQFWFDFLPEWGPKTMATGMGAVLFRFFPSVAHLVITLGPFLVHSSSADQRQ